MIEKDQRYRKRISRYVLASHVFLTGMLASPPAMAKPPEVKVIEESRLDFGSFVVPVSGSRSISPSGAVRDVGLFPLEASKSSPGRYSIRYDRGNESSHVLDLEFQIVIFAPDHFRVGEVEASLSSFESSLPGAAQFKSGQVLSINIAACRTRVCSRSFEIGGRIDVKRQSGGANLAIPVLVEATLVSVDRR